MATKDLVKLTAVRGQRDTRNKVAATPRRRGIVRARVRGARANDRRTTAVNDGVDPTNSQDPREASASQVSAYVDKPTGFVHSTYRIAATHKPLDAPDTLVVETSGNDEIRIDGNRSTATLTTLRGETFDLVDAASMAARRRLGDVVRPKRVVRPMTARDVRRARRRRLEDESGEGSDDDPEYAIRAEASGPRRAIGDGSSPGVATMERRRSTSPAAASTRDPRFESPQVRRGRRGRR